LAHDDRRRVEEPTGCIEPGGIDVDAALVLHEVARQIGPTVLPHGEEPVAAARNLKMVLRAGCRAEHPVAGQSMDR
jgi:hypothetical protein